MFRQVLQVKHEEEAKVRGLHHNLACESDMLPDDFPYETYFL